MPFDPAGINPEAAALGAGLLEVSLRHTTGAVLDAIKAVKAKRNNQETINELEQIINDLLEDRNELVRIGEAYRQEFVAQQISPENIKYITESFIPRVEELLRQIPGDATTANMQQTLDAIKSLLSVEMLTVLQVVGFNFKRAIGEPLTLLLQKLITSKIPQDPHAQMEFNSLNAAFMVELAKIAQDRSATERWERLRGPVVWEHSEG